MQCNIFIIVFSIIFVLLIVSLFYFIFTLISIKKFVNEFSIAIKKINSCFCSVGKISNIFKITDKDKLSSFLAFIASILFFMFSVVNKIKNKYVKDVENKNEK